MQKQTVNKIISDKISEWIESVNDTELRLDLRKHVLVSGGSIASLFLGEPVKDYDVYLQDRSTLLRLVNYYTKPISTKDPDELFVFDELDKSSIEKQFPNAEARSTGQLGIAIRNLKTGQIKIYAPNGGYKVDYEEGTDLKKYRPLFFSPNAISLSDDIQIVNRFYGTPEEIHKTFDFIHATNYFTFASGVVTNQKALESLLSKQLYYQGSLYPVTSIIRMKKFIKRNWNITAGEIFKSIFQASLLDLRNPDVLEEQLIGVDVAYFSILIKALRAKFDSEPNFVITPEYANTIIDRIFNGESNVAEDGHNSN